MYIEGAVCTIRFPQLPYRLGRFRYAHGSSRGVHTATHFGPLPAAGRIQSAALYGVKFAANPAELPLGRLGSLPGDVAADVIYLLLQPLFQSLELFAP